MDEITSKLSSHHGPAVDAHEEGSSAAGWLVLAVLITLALRGILWMTGFESRELNLAVEEGAARVERKGVGEVGDDVIRKAIQLQRSTLPFWSTLASLTDFVLDPFLLVSRALLVAICFSSLAALTGRPVRFGLALDQCALIQFYWVVGLALKTLLMLVLRRPEVETSAALLLPVGRYPASLVLLLRQFDILGLLGWATLAWSAWRRGQANLFTACFVSLILLFSEASVRMACGLLIGAGMRLSILPDTVG